MDMATGSVSRTGMGVARGSQGKATGDGTALSVTLGFRPKYVMIYNATDATKWEYLDGLAATQSIKTVTAGTMTTDTTSAITITDTGFATTAALNASGKALVWYAE